MENIGSKQFTWTPELVDKLLNHLEEIADKWINYKQNEAEAKKNEAEAKIKHLQAEAEAEDKYIQATTKHNRHTLYALIAFLGGVILFMGFLTYSGRVSGDALLFLVGTVTGYVIVLIQRLIFVFTPETTHSEIIQEESKE
jgi:hypothetical protein